MTSLDVLDKDYVSLNARLNLYDKDGRIQFDADKRAVRSYFLNHVNENMRFFYTLRERINFLVDNGYYEAVFLEAYDWNFVEALHQKAYDKRHRFETFFGAFKFYTSYALKERTKDENGVKRYLERYEDRVVITALYLAQGSEQLATDIMEEILSSRLQPATPTFQNAGRRGGGKLVSCFLLNTPDNIEGIMRGIMSAAFLSKIGGGVAFCMTDVRSIGDKLSGIDNLAKGVKPFAKINEMTFSAVDQLGQRPGAGALYINVHHPDILSILDSKRDNAATNDQLQTLSIGVVIPDITMQLAEQGEDLYTFSPYDIQKAYGKPFSQISVTEEYENIMANPNIRKIKRGTARDLLARIAEIQFESGYPYILFEDAANESNPIKGRVSMSNLCSEILQVSTPSVLAEDGTYEQVGQDISCNLASLNVAKVMQSPNFGKTVETAIRALTAVSRMTDLNSVPTIKAGNDAGHSIGLGQMNLHGFFGSVGIHYENPEDPSLGASAEAVDFTSAYFAAVAYHAINTSNMLAVEFGESFEEFEESKYADGSFFEKYVTRDWLPVTEKVQQLFSEADIYLPTSEDWTDLRDRVMSTGMYNRYLQAVPPTGSISYINNSTSSIHPITAQVEIREEGQIGRKYYPAYGLTNENREFYKDAYEIGPYAVIDVYAAAQEHVDQGLSLTLFFTDKHTTADINLAQKYAFFKGCKTLYYVRLRTEAIEGTQVQECVSCAL